MKRLAATSRFNVATMKTAGRRAARLLLLLTLAGCSFKPTPPPDSLPLFSIYAQIILHQPGKAKQRFLVVWHHHDSSEGEHDELEVKNPLGSTQARLTLKPQMAMLEYQGKQLQEKNGNALAQRVFGTPLPIDAFRYWINGFAAPATAAKIQKNADGSISEINQLDWNIIYLSYNDNKRPQKIKMNSSTGLQVAIDIQRWLQQ